MNIKTLQAIFSKMDNDKFVFTRCFGKPDYKYNDGHCEFMSDMSISLKDIKANIESAMNHYGHNENDVCILTYSNELFEDIVGQMLVEYYSNQGE